jgi:hypothetical protein
MNLKSPLFFYISQTTLTVFFRWSSVEYASVFHEVVNDGRATPSEVATAITYVKLQFPPLTSPITTIDTFTAYK